MSIAGELNSKLVKHYKCFNEERFFVDEANEDYISIVSTSIEDPCPLRLCRYITKYTLGLAKKIGLKPTWIYVGPWAFDIKKVERL